MPASLPGDTLANNTTGNPSTGQFVIMDPLSGPKGSPLDKDSAGHASTGALSTGIGVGSSVIGQTPQNNTAPVAIFKAGYNDNQTPGQVPTYAAPPPIGVVSSSAANSVRMYIGGGRMAAQANDKGRPFIPNPYTAGIALVGAGAGVARDGGLGPSAFTGFPMKMVTATGAVATGAAIETGFLNVSGVAMVSGQSAFGSGATELAAPS